MAMLLNLLVSSLFLLTLPNLISVEGRKFKTSNGGGGVFKVDLIHRDSPHSPYYNSSMTPQERLKKSPLGYISNGHNVIHLSSTHYNTSDVELADLIPNGGGYLMKIAIGTPKVEFHAFADTGSDLIWVQCLPCVNCISKISPPFNPTKSSTFQSIPCNSPACTKPDLPKTGCSLKNTTTDSSSSTCNYQYDYESGSTGGILAMETISLPSTSLSLPSTIFGCGTNQTVWQADGIIGLGTGPSSLISQLGPNINYKFSYCLPPLTSQVNGKLAFGANVTGPGLVSTPFFIGNFSTAYYLSLDSITISVEGEDVMVPAGLDIVLDSGTTLTFLPASVYDSVKKTLKTAIGLNTVSSPYESYELCYNSSGHAFNPPHVVFHFEGAHVVLKAINTFRTFEEYGVSCLAMLATENVAIFGNIAQVNFEIGYDLQAQQVSFVPTDCTKY